MDKSKVQEFSDTLRTRLLEETGKRATHFGVMPDSVLEVEQEFEDSIIIGGKVFPAKIKKQREMFVREIQEKGYAQVLDEVTYIWFNRFAALKFMEANDILPVRVFSSADAGKNEPDILTDVLKLKFLRLDRERVLDLKSAGKDEELYRYLLMSLCNFLHKTMPFLFEKIEDYTELLFPGRMLHTDSILDDLNTIIAEEDWKEVEILGWIYQDYIAEKKDALIKAKKQYTPQQIPAVTQLFTPKWIVQYLVENSLGRLWMLNRPHSKLAEQMAYYIQPEEPETDFLRVSSPEEIRICDPACGSGHMLVYAFDLLYAMYEEEGYVPAEIPEMIITHNLYGIEIDRRAGEIAAFALVMKARRKNRHFFDNPVQPHICVLQNISFEDEELRAYASAIGSNLFTTDLMQTLSQFEEAEHFGSLIRPVVTNVSDLRQMLAEKQIFSNITFYETHKKVKQALTQAEYLSPNYHVVVANPPYMGGKGMNADLKKFLKDNYTDVKSDLYAAFIVRNTELALPKGQLGFVTPYVWMFISSYEKLRNYILEKCTITSLIQLEYNAFEPACIPVCTFCLENEYHPEIKGNYVRLSDFRGSENQSPKTLEIIHNYNQYLKEAQ